ncbi:MAG: hypothetical protein M3Y72_18075 [Acidobacteriota bacterium]|nr:hypothetical protein [Acidobacteriota bacterium]
MKLRIASALLLVTSAVAVAYQVHVVRETSPPLSLTAYIPQDALLTIESPDFSSLLDRWSTSAESKAWLASDNYSVFKNSRLFGRLTDAQTSFAAAAAIPADVDLLKQVAGKESVLAWYDIGKLQFLYITRMPTDQASQTRLVQSRASFDRHHAGNADFYIRTSGNDYGTVAFAQVGDLLLLATREDLIANALVLIAGGTPPHSVAQEPWFQDASAALPREQAAPALHMVLNLDRIAVDPHFRSYWVQQNITWTRQFRAAASDLYLEPTRFREERVLLPRSPEPASTSDVTALADLAPDSIGVFRAVATDDPSVAVTAIQEKLLGSYATPSANPGDAPDPSLEAQQVGSASDLETRIDTAPPVSGSASVDGLKQLFRSANTDAVLSLSSAQSPATKDGLWVPIHSAVVVRTAHAMAPQALAAALQQALRGSLTASTLGIEFHANTIAGASIDALTGPCPMFFATSSSAERGNLVLIADDQSLLVELLHSLAMHSPSNATPATTIASFNHNSQSGPYLRVTSLIDGTNERGTAGTNGIGADSPSATAPAFFSRNIGSLSSSFATLQSERVVERAVDANLRQTVTYNWQIP